VTSKAYFRWLIFFVALLGIALLGWIAYFLIPRQPEAPEEMKYLAFKEFSSPTYKYQFLVLGEEEATWKDVYASPEMGQKFLSLIRGSKNYKLVVQEYLAERPEMAKALAMPNVTKTVARMNVCENGSENPSLTINFQLDGGPIIVAAPNRQSEAFVILPEKEQELDDLMTELQFGPRPKEPSGE